MTEKNPEFFMDKALDTAREAIEVKEIPVGAVVVENGDIIGKGYNRQKADSDPSAHAEIVALRKAAQYKNNFRLDGCDLYVTVKPCKMCREAIKRARINKVYFGSPKAREATHTTKYRKLKDFSNPAAELIRGFFKNRR